MNKTIIIVGGGTAGWITASILAKGLDSSNYSITLIESPDIPTVGVGEATIPPIIQLARFLEIDEADMLKSIEATFKYGIHFQDWAQKGQGYMHAFGYMNTIFQNHTFPELWLKCKETLSLAPLNNYIPTSVAAYKNKFSLPVAASNPNIFSPASELNYAYQFDASLLASYLTNYATNLNVKHIKATLTNVNINNKGDISSVEVNNAENSITGDYFIDCTGARSLLNKKALGGEFQPWKKYLPCDRATVVQTKSTEPPIPYTKSIAMDAGWRWKIPLQHRDGNGYVHASDFCSQLEAEKEIEQALHGKEKINALRTINFETGCLTKPWLKNCIALGLSSGFLEPLESTSIHMTHKYAIEFMNALRYGENMADEADLFNNNFNQDMLTIRDFLILHYKITQREDTEFWRYCKGMELPDSLKAKLEEFDASGYITLPQSSLFSYQSWFQLLIGQNYFSNYKKFEDKTIDLTKAKQFFSQLENIIDAEMNKLPSHCDFLTKYLK